MSTKKLIGEVDLTGGVVPITKAASSLAALIKRSNAYQQPIVVTQKGYPTGVILDVELFTLLRENAERYLAGHTIEGMEGVFQNNPLDRVREEDAVEVAS